MERRAVLALVLIFCMAWAMPVLAQAGTSEGSDRPIAPVVEAVLAGDGVYETSLDVDGQLSVRTLGAAEWTSITADVRAAQLLAGHVYYLQTMGTGARLMDYDIESALSERIEYFEEPMAAALAVASDRAYVVTEQGVLFALNMDGMQAPTELATLEAGLELRLAIEDGMLLVSDGSDPADVRLISSFPIEPAATEKPALVEIKRGDKGDGVKDLQAALSKQGYLKGTVDGNFGASTERAVRYLQFDMGRADTGKADVALQQALFDGSAPTYQAHVALKRGDRGIRVSDMQTRLRELHYTKYAVDGSYGSATADAIVRFQDTIGDKQNGAAITVKQLGALFKSSARKCTKYYTLESGDDAPVVLSLNKRLKKLGYLAGTAGNLYTKNTTKAIRAFQAQAGIKQTGIADAKTQRQLFASSAPGPSPTPEPTPVPPTKQAVSSSAIKTLRTWLKNNLDLDYTKSEAVAHLQDRLVKRGYLSSSSANKVYNTDTKNAVANFQKDNGLKSSGVVNKNTLKALFD